ncbi:mavicyanin-like [Salvia splendens]|uniref:mavicyanin-like n=1 Tax=Salvia splendens TaxID=180675 RepID=UPI001C254532|nr:mavicyanin-like [Salvia splendens]
MALRMAVCLIAVLGWFEVRKGAVYKVGDSAGWTTIGNVDYKLWSSTKTFQLGDVIVFEYNPQFHNVMQVIHLEYKACNASSPISTHTTGNDSITINTHGHHFFVCGVPGHCQSGQKVDINVLRSPSVKDLNP